MANLAPRQSMNRVQPTSSIRVCDESESRQMQYAGAMRYEKLVLVDQDVRVSFIRGRTWTIRRTMHERH